MPPFDAVDATADLVGCSANINASPPSRGQLKHLVRPSMQHAFKIGRYALHE
jgi:hypothetical protein